MDGGVRYGAGAPDSGSVSVANGGATAARAWASGKCLVAFRYALPLHGLTVPLVRATYRPQPGFRLDSIVRDSVKARDLKVYGGPEESDSTARATGAMAGVVHNDVGQIAFFYLSRYSPCSWTTAWWKAHAASAASPLLPLWLGRAGGALSVQVTSAAEVVPLLTVNGNPAAILQRLYAELLAARLNLAAGANGSAVAATVAAADAFLARHDAVIAGQRAAVLGWITALAQYNDGAIGPGRCPG